MGLWSVGPKLQRPGPFCLDLDSPKPGPDVPMNTSFNIGNWKETSVKISGPCGLYYYSILQMSGTFFLSSFQINIFQLHEKKTIYSGHSATWQIIQRFHRTIIFNLTRDTLIPRTRTDKCYGDFGNAIYYISCSRNCILFVIKMVL